MSAPRLTSRLAAKQGIRQVEAHAKADAFADGLDRVYARAWREVLKVLKSLPAGRPSVLSQADRRRVEGAFEGVFGAPNTFFPKALKSLVAWGHRSARAALASELPSELAKVAAWNEVADGSERRTPRTDEVVGADRNSGGLTHRGRFVGEGVNRLPHHVQRIREDVSADLSRFLFPAPDEATVNRIIYAGDWMARLAAGTKLAPPSLLASILSAGLIAGKNHQEIARDLLPHVERNRASARRIARTEALRVAAVTQMQCHSQLGDLVIGYQIHATLDQHTRPEHAARSGTIYFESPGPGQLGYEDMPHPPHESPRQGSKIAWNCRCYLTPVLRPLTGGDGASLTPAHVPDPLVYSDWFSATNEKTRRVAVGTRRYSLLRDLLDRPPQWSDFLDPKTGSLLSQAELAAETPTQRAERAAKVRSWLGELKRLATATSALGFVP